MIQVLDSQGRLKVTGAGGGGGGNTGSISAGTTNATLGEVVFSNSNGVSFGLDGQTVTASHNGLTSQSNQAFSAQGGSSAFQTLIFTNSNGISFSNTNGSVWGSHNGLTSQSNQAFSAQGGSSAFQTLVFNNANGLTFSNNAGSVEASYTVPSTAGLLSNIRVSAGTTSNLLSAFTFNNGNGITFGLDASTITASHNGLTSQSNQAVSAANGSYAFQTLSFSNANGISFGTSAGSAITGSYTVPTVTNSSWTVSDAVTSATVGRLAFTNSNGLTLSLSTSNNGNHTVIGSYTVPTVTNSSWTVSDAVTSQTIGRLAFTNANGLTMTLSTSNNGNATVFGSYTVPTQSNQTIGLYGVGNTTQNSSTTLDARTVSFRGNQDITVGYSNGSVQLSVNVTGAQSNQTAGLYAVGNTTQNSSTTLDARTISYGGRGNITVGYSNGTVQISGSQSNQDISLYAAGNTTQNSSSVINASSLLFRGTGNVSVGFSNGSVIISDTGAAGGGITNINLSAGTTSNNLSQFVLSDSNHVSFGLSGSTVTASFNAINVGVSTGGNTAGTTGTVEGAGGQYLFVGSRGVTLSQSTNGANFGTVTIIGPQIFLSSYKNMPNINNSSVLTFGMTSLSQAAAFIMPQDGSFSFIRIPVTMSTNSTTIATLASATATAQGGISHTFNAVVYSMGTGGNSQSLQSVASGSCGMTFSQQISITNSTQGSYSLGITGNANGGAANTNLTTQYSISNTNYSFTTNQIATQWSAGRFIDIPFANSLSEGNYWLVIGASSSTSSAGAAGLAALTNCHVRYSGHYGVSQVNVGFGVMGSTNMTSGGQLGAGFFSTAGGGTTNSIPISAISSTASNPKPFFIMLRSA